MSRVAASSFRIIPRFDQFDSKRTISSATWVFKSIWSFTNWLLSRAFVFRTLLLIFSLRFVGWNAQSIPLRRSYPFSWIWFLSELTNSEVRTLKRVFTIGQSAFRTLKSYSSSGQVSWFIVVAESGRKDLSVHLKLLSSDDKAFYKRIKSLNLRIIDLIIAKSLIFSTGATTTYSIIFPLNIPPTRNQFLRTAHLFIP